VNRHEAGIVVGRLNAHFPTVAATDISARDWIDTVSRLTRAQADEICTLLIQSWNRDRAPRLADWQEVARQVAARQVEHRWALEDVSVAPERCGELIAMLRDRLAGTTRCSCRGCEARARTTSERTTG
jgi:hypothetical protein